MVTSAPDFANCVATARPIPLLPPVTMADRPARLMSIQYLPCAPAPDLGPLAATSPLFRSARGRTSTPGVGAGQPNDSADAIIRRRAIRFRARTQAGTRDGVHRTVSCDHD